MQKSNTAINYSKAVTLLASAGVLLAFITLAFLALPYPVYGQDQLVPRLVLNESVAWNDQFAQCSTSFECSVDSRTGWKDNKSMLVSTTTGTWSWISSPEISGSAGKSYNIASHMRLNEETRASHIVIEGFNQTSDQWYQVAQCPPGINGSLQWSEFNCGVTIPSDTPSIRLTINAGYPAETGENANTWLDEIYITPLDGSPIALSENSREDTNSETLVLTQDESGCRLTGFVSC
jgi:hypothetical protein